MKTTTDAGADVSKCAPRANTIDGCRCAPELTGAQTHSIKIGSNDRCFTIMKGDGDGPRPTMVLPNSYFKDNPDKIIDRMTKFARRGISTVFVSRNDGKDDEQYWSIRRSDASVPQNCQSVDIYYVDAVLQYLDNNLADQFDPNRRYVYGMSHNSAMSNYIAYCLSEKFRGTFQSSNCLIEKGFPISTNLQGWFDIKDKPNDNKTKPDTNDTIFPVLPCFEPTHTVMTCLASGKNDQYTVDENKVSMHPHAYERTVAEGNLAAIINWTSLKGHQESEFAEEWTISCLGVYPICSETCWDKTKGTQEPTCDYCAATQENLNYLQPAAVTGSFGGPPSDYVHTRPSTSTCTHTKLPEKAAWS